MNCLFEKGREVIFIEIMERGLISYSFLNKLRKHTQKVISKEVTTPIHRIVNYCEYLYR